MFKWLLKQRTLKKWWINNGRVQCHLEGCTNKRLSSWVGLCSKHFDEENRRWAKQEAESKFNRDVKVQKEAIKQIMDEGY